MPFPVRAGPSCWSKLQARKRLHHQGNDSIMTPKGQFDIGGIGIHGGKGANYLYLDGHVAFMNTPLALGQSWPSTKLETYEKWDMGYKAQ